MMRVVSCLIGVLYIFLLLQRSASGEESHLYTGTQALWKDGAVISNQPEEDGKFHVPAMGYVVIENTIPDNFSLTFDVQGAMMPGIGFRADPSLASYEYFYFRVYADAQPQETIQYIPTFNGEMSWQLYNYPLYEREAKLKANETFSVKLMVVKNKAALYLNDDREPAMVIDPLLTSRRGGKLLFTSISKAFVVSNLQLQPLADDVSLPPAQHVPEQLSGTLQSWSLSTQFDCGNSSYIFQCVSKLKNGVGDLKKVQADSQGVVNLSRYYDVPGRWVLATTELESSGKRQVTLEYDYTHEVAIFLNGQPIFTGKEIDRDNGNFGRVIPGEESIMLSLEEGKNTLSFAVHGDEELGRYYDAKRLGLYQARNWGFTARIVPTKEPVQ
ncbi:MAG: hypothetical protein HWE26_08420 [Alteromonadaceae bacterium]|nr:hypothetical protein [Alteromonadaceae bacterium]